MLFPTVESLYLWSVHTRFLAAYGPVSGFILQEPRVPAVRYRMLSPGDPPYAGGLLVTSSKIVNEALKNGFWTGSGARRRKGPLFTAALHG